MHPHRPTRSSLAVLAVVLGAALVAACSATGGGATAGAGGTPAGGSAATPGPSTIGTGKAPFIPQIVSSQQVVGPNRFVFGIDDAKGQTSIGTPDLAVEVGFQSSATPAATIEAVPATFIWAIQGERGVYAANVTFPAAGDWVALFRATGAGLPSDATVSVQFQVQQTGVVVPIGAQAPSVVTPTAATAADIPKIATDPDPDPAFYTTSEDQALARHEPFVLVFATPKFCVSKQCGPTLDGIKAVAKTEAPGIVFINVEPYKLTYANGSLQPVLDASGQLQATDATTAWRLLSEPWVFVVDKQGIVRASFETIVSPDELKAAIAAVR